MIPLLGILMHLESSVFAALIEFLPSEISGGKALFSVSGFATRVKRKGLAVSVRQEPIQS